MVSFSRAQTFIQRLIRDHRIPGVGPLTQYLLVTDMCYAGIVEMPDAQEIGTTIHRLKLGGQSGLVKLGFLPFTAKSYSSETVVDAFRSFYSEMEQKLAQMDRDNLREYWNPIVAEHTLCKFARMEKDLVEARA